MIGGFRSLSSQLRGYIATTTVESSDYFGNTELKDGEPLIIAVNFTEAYNLDINQLANVDTSANGGLANGKVLVYDSSSGKFDPSSLVYASNLTDLADVTIASPALGEVVRHNGTNWANTTLIKDNCFNWWCSCRIRYTKRIGCRSC